MAGDAARLCGVCAGDGETPPPVHGAGWFGLDIPH